MTAPRKTGTISASDDVREAMAKRAPPPAKIKQPPVTSLKSGTRVGEVYWCDFSHTNLIPEFDSEHLVMVIKSARLTDVSLVIPLTKRDQSSNQHGYKLKHNPNEQTADESWAVCDHIYAVSSGRLRPLRTTAGQMRKPFTLDPSDIEAISRHVRRVLTPFLQKGIASSDPASGVT
ncbi:MAG: type II toxin-antitoxin system PemK/MazF family toxin [Alphaproteobacteria bacterium]|nr:type II toxin-antitoxin system PemK/MazF family toxin [Alphaproteobacteria bacterium]